jgi:hypothetical protein
MNSNIALVIDTTTRYSDAWGPCFGRLKKYFPENIKKYVFVNPTDHVFDEGFYQVNYDDSESYRNQFLSCIKKVEEPYILYTSEDYILYDQVSEDKINQLVKVLSEDSSYNSIKLIKGGEKASERYKPESYDDLYIIDNQDSNFFAQQASIWRTRDFEKIFEASPPNNTRMQQEPGGSQVCRDLGFNILQCYNQEPLRGMAHHDSSTYPYVATAIVKGMWNVSEYPEELKEVFNEYGVDYRKRGIR